MATSAVSDTTFENEVKKADLPVLVDFWAEWCGPCRMVAPILEELSEEFTGQLKVVKLDVESNPSASRRLIIFAAFRRSSVQEWTGGRATDWRAAEAPAQGLAIRGGCILLIKIAQSRPSKMPLHGERHLLFWVLVRHFSFSV